MNDQKHRSIVDHYEACLKKHGDSHLGVDWPNAQDAEKRYAVMLELVRECREGMSLLDFGCGTSQLYPHMRESQFSCLEYTGLDISPAFCEVARSKYPHLDFLCLDVLAAPDALGQFDYIVMNGVFTEKRDLTFEAMFDYFREVLRLVFPKVRHGLAFNVMSKAVDWERDELFHLPLDLLVKFMVQELSRHFVIRNDYGLYEYSVYLYKSPSNV